MLKAAVGGAADLPASLLTTLAGQASGLAGTASNIADPTCGRLGSLNYQFSILPGTVVRSGIGTYACEVAIGSDICVCSVMSTAIGELSGVSHSSLPVEGSCVLVYQTLSGRGQPTGYGVILGVLPNTLPSPGGVSDSSLVKAVDYENTEGAVSLLTEEGPSAIECDVNYSRTADLSGGRPVDIVPGEYSVCGRAGQGLHIGALSTTVRGSELSSIRCSAIDDQVRVVSDHFQHISAAGVSEIYNDGGFISIETSVSMYQPERYGVSDWDGAAFEEESKAQLDTLDRDGKCGIKPKEHSQTSRPRIRNFTGYLGDIVNFFVSRPGDVDSAAAMERPVTGRQEQGLLHAHVDSSGVATLRSAAGIMLERYDRIPVPKRIRQPWDPEGDLPEDGGLDPDKHSGFTLDSRYPGANGLVLADMAAWWNHLAYMHLRQFEKDFDIPRQDDSYNCRCPDAEYDRLGKGTNDIKEYDLRHSYVSLTPDGGIVLRDAWGSEIVMQGGNITISAANNIELRSGKTTVVLAGDDAVVKAYNSVDVSATHKDVRLKAEKNLHAVSADGGVLIQSSASGDSVQYKDRVGEDVVSSGVLIKADTSSVACIGARAHIGGRELVSVESMADDDSPSGDIVVVGKTVSTVADSSITSAVGDGGEAGVIITKSSTVVAGRSAILTGETGLLTEANGSAYVGFAVDADSVYPSAAKVFKALYSRFASDQKWLSPYKPAEASDYRFTFRTSEQYGTTSANHFPASDGGFHVVQPSWTLLTSGRPWMAGISAKAWDEKPDQSDTGEYPWPGREAYDSDGTYVTYSETNIAESGVESVPDGGTSDDDPRCSPKLTTGTFSQYHIRS